MKPIFHILHKQDWQKAINTGELQSETLGSLGFMHCCTQEQIQFVLENWFSGENNLVIVEIDPDKISATLVYENLEGGEDLFPHIYGPIEMSAVVDTREMN